jgi:N-acetyltransferase
MASGDLGPCVLEGDFVRLEPLRREHVAALLEVAKDFDWGWFLNPLRTKEDVDLRIVDGLKAEERGEGYAFAVRLRSTGRIIGSTSYMALSARHKRVEIGSTWYTPSEWGTAVNPDCKYLLLRHAFEDWGAVRVQFTTDVNNVHSQHAITKLGAKFEGKLRSHAIRPDGSLRDSMVYSIIASEWPEVRTKLLARIQSF